ncbi:putative alpha/beta hydrolases superfamily protein [Tanacetum coccineum]
MWTEADDLRSVIKHFNEANRVTSAILGHSKGGNVVLLYASKYHDVPRVINVSGRYKTEGGVEERLGKGFLQKVQEDGFIDVKGKTGEFLYRVTEYSLMERLNTNMHEACLQIDKDCRKGHSERGNGGDRNQTTRSLAVKKMDRGNQILRLTMFCCGGSNTEKD